MKKRPTAYSPDARTVVPGHAVTYHNEPTAGPGRRHPLRATPAATSKSAIKSKPAIKSKRPVFATRADKLAATDVAQYNTERMFAAENIVKALLASSNSALVFAECDEGEEQYGTCELAGVDDARDKSGCGGAWVSVRIYVPNLDIDTEINR